MRERDSQICFSKYSFEKGRLIVHEMMELLSLDLVRKGILTKKVTLTIGFDRESLVGERGQNYTGVISKNYYGRPVPKHAHGTENLDHYTSSTKLRCASVLRLYDRIVDPNLLLRRVNVVAEEVILERDKPEDEPLQLDFFSDYEKHEQKKEQKKQEEEREHRLQKATLRKIDLINKNMIISVHIIQQWQP